MNELCEAAHDYVNRGWHVFPVEPGGKRPLGRLVPNGFKDATTDPDTILRWWNDAPEANVGIATGADSGLVVIDVDDLTDGLNAMDELELAHELLPPTLTAQSPHGFHRYFRHPGGQVPCSTSKVASHVDIRGDGGCITAPPSRVAGHEYRWCGGLLYPMPTLPPWLANLCAEKPVQPAPTRRRLVSKKSGLYGHAALEDEADQVRSAPEGQRNHTLNRASFKIAQLVAVGRMDIDEAWETLFNAAVEAGLPTTEIERTMRSGFERGLEQPRRVAS